MQEKRGLREERVGEFCSIKILAYEAVLMTVEKNIPGSLSLPRVINFKFPLRTHQKYYIAQYEERGSS